MSPLPELRCTIGNRGKVKDASGQEVRIEVLDEVRQPHIGHSLGKYLILQKLLFVDDGREEFRLGYYIIGREGQTRGKWMWPRFTPMMRPDDFAALMDKARAKGWI